MLPPAVARLVRLLAYASFTLATASVLLFLVLELTPSLRLRPGLDGVRYYGLQRRYADDPELVFVPRHVTPGAIERAETRGDLYSARYGVDVPVVRYEMSWNEWGFRANASAPPADVLVIGDSYVEIGETDADTLSERVRAASGLSTFNLGRGWYGTHQYLALLRRFAPIVEPRYALLCFFAGNDAENVEEYTRWRRGGRYYDWGAAQQPLPIRYGIAMADGWRWLGERLEEAARSRRARPQPPAGSSSPSPAPAAAAAVQGPLHPKLGAIALGTRRSRCASRTGQRR